MNLNLAPPRILPAIHIVGSPFDLIVVLIAAAVVVIAALFIVGTAANERERTLRLLFLYLTYGVLEIIVKRGAHYAWHLYLIKFGLFFAVLLSWWQWRQHTRSSVTRPPLASVLGLYLALAGIQIFNPYQLNALVGAFGWLSDFIFAVFYFVAFDLFDDVTPVRRFLRLTAILGVLSAIGCFTEQWIGPDQLMLTYPAYVRLVHFGLEGAVYRPMALSAFSEIFGIAAMLGLMASRRVSIASLLVLGAGIAACTVANILHAVRISWLTGFAIVALFSVLSRQRRIVSLLLVIGSIMLAINVGMTVTDGLISMQFESMTQPLKTFQDNRLRGLRSITTIVPAYPFGVGVGESSAGLRLIDATGVTTFGVHNYLAELAAQLSIVGPLLLLAFCAGVVVTALRASWNARPDERRAFVLVGVAIFGAVTATFFGGGGLGSYPLNDYFWLMAGATMSLVQTRRSPVTAVGVTQHVRFRNLVPHAAALRRTRLAPDRPGVGVQDGRRR